MERLDRWNNLRSERGAEVIELALVLPVLLLVTMGIVEFGFLFQRYVVLTNAAMEGARVGTLPGYDFTDAEARVQEYVTNGRLQGTVTAQAIPVALPAAGGGTWPGVQVTATHVYTYQYITPVMVLFGGSSFTQVTLTARSTMRTQVAAGGS